MSCMRQRARVRPTRVRRESSEAREEIPKAKKATKKVQGGTSKTRGRPSKLKSSSIKTKGNKDEVKRAIVSPRRSKRSLPQSLKMSMERKSSTNSGSNVAKKSTINQPIKRKEHPRTQAIQPPSASGSAAAYPSSSSDEDEEFEMHEVPRSAPKIKGPSKSSSSSKCRELPRATGKRRSYYQDKPSPSSSILSSDEGEEASQGKKPKNTAKVSVSRKKKQ